MARLPQPGQDSGSWGDILNAFLRVEHNDDGTLKASGSLLNKYTKPPMGIPEADLSSGVQAKLNAAGSGSVANDSIVTAMLQDGAVTTPKLAAGIQTKLSALSGTNTGDQDLSGLVPKTTTVNSKALSGNISITKSDVGLSNVDNTSDANKPISTATQTALDAKANSTDLTPYFNKSSDTTDAITESATKKFLSSADKTKLDGIASGAQVNVQADWNASTGDAQILNKPTIPSVPVQSVNTKVGAVVLDPDDLSDTTTTNKFVTAADKTKLSNLSGTNTGDQDLSGLVPKTTTVNSKALTGNITLTGADLSLTKADVGLGNVDNTADSAKPVSTAQAAAIAAKEPAITAGTSAQYYRGDKTMQTLNQDAVPDGTTNKAYTTIEKTKLSGIATGATANSSDATLLDRANHTGIQAQSTVTNLVSDLSSKLTNITGLVTAGTNVTVTGSGTSGAPYVVNSTASNAVNSVNTRTGAVTGLAEDNTVVHLAGTETITGTKTFSATTTATNILNASKVGIATTNSTKYPLEVYAGSANSTLFAASYQNNNTTNSGSAVGFGFSVNNFLLVKGGIGFERTNSFGRGKMHLMLEPTADNTTEAAIASSMFDVDYTGAANHRGTLSMNSNPITNVTNPTNAQDAATKNYVDTATTVVHTTGTETITGAKTFSSAPTLSGATITDATDIVLGTTTGTKFGTATTQKIGFYGVTPVAQQAATADIGSILASIGIRAAGTTYTITTSGSVAIGSGGMRSTTTTRTTTVTLGATSNWNELCDATTGAFTITLPAANASTGQMIWFKKIDSSANAVTIQRAGTDTIDGATTYTLSTQYKFVELVNNGSNAWFIRGNN